MKITITGYNAQSTADYVIHRFETGTVKAVNGRELYDPWGHGVASAWGNGTLSFSTRVKAGTPGRVRTVFVKPGQTLELS